MAPRCVSLLPAGGRKAGGHRAFLMRRCAILLAGLTALSGCSLAPHYERPATPTPPDTFKESGDWKVATPADTAPRGQWWQVFQDQELDGLEAQVTAANQSLKAAFAQLEQAKAQTRIARSALFPSLDANAGAIRERVSDNSPSYTPGKPATGNLFTVAGSLSYELDLFGRVRNTVASTPATASRPARATSAGSTSPCTRSSPPTISRCAAWTLNSSCSTRRSPTTPVPWS